MSNPPVLRPYPFTGEEWRNMAMPPCPKCGETIEADRVEVTPGLRHGVVRLTPDG